MQYQTLRICPFLLTAADVQFWEVKGRENRVETPRHPVLRDTQGHAGSHPLLLTVADGIFCEGPTAFGRRHCTSSEKAEKSRVPMRLHPPFCTKSKQAHASPSYSFPLSCHQEPQKDPPPRLMHTTA